MQAMDRYEDITVILPTLNEGRNIAAMLRSLGMLYPGACFMVSDDGSTDHTRIQCANSAVPCHFIDRSSRPVKGLTASVLEAIGEVGTPFFIVIDADGQHPPEKIAQIVDLLRSGTELVLANRVQVVGRWELHRKALSRFGTFIGRLSLRLRGRNFGNADILSGFFGVRTEKWRQAVAARGGERVFCPEGFKILFDFLKCVPKDLRIGAVGYDFHIRGAGYSKLTFRVYRQFLRSCLLF